MSLITDGGERAGRASTARSLRAARQRSVQVLAVTWAHESGSGFGEEGRWGSPQRALSMDSGKHTGPRGDLCPRAGRGVAPVCLWSRPGLLAGWFVQVSGSCLSAWMLRSRWGQSIVGATLERCACSPGRAPAPGLSPRAFGKPQGRVSPGCTYRGAPRSLHPLPAPREVLGGGGNL